jgi:hypothetical protein
MKAYTIKTDSAGKESLAFGLGTPPVDQKKYIVDCQMKKPAGIQRLVMISEAGGKIKQYNAPAKPKAKPKKKSE